MNTEVLALGWTDFTRGSKGPAGDWGPGKKNLEAGGPYTPLMLREFRVSPHGTEMSAPDSNESEEVP